MSDALTAASAGAQQYLMRLDILANNLANANTAAFKEDKPYFRMPDSGAASAGSSAPGGGDASSPYEMHVNFSPGMYKDTHNALDLALYGDGFLCVRTPEGENYTRKGNLTLNADGVLVTQEGNAVMGRRGEIVIKGGKIDIEGDGTIRVDGNEVEKLKLVDFRKPYKLSKKGNSLFSPSDPETRPLENAAVEVRQGAMELSNVDSVRCMTEMIDVMRGFESYQKVIQFLNETSSKAINEVGRI